MVRILKLDGRTAVSAHAGEATTENSKGNGENRAGAVVRLGVAVVALAGVLLMVIAEFSPLLRVDTGEGSPIPDSTVQTGPHHSYALLVLAVAATLLTYGAVRGASRPALAALALVGLAGLAIAFFHDLPDTKKHGALAKSKEQLYFGASTSRKSGLGLELIGASLLVVAGAGGLVLGRR
jgi:hypothetical protein